MSEGTDALLSVQQLSVAFEQATTRVYAVNGLNLILQRGEVLALVGESGCGKSMTALAIMGLLPDAARLSVASQIKLADIILSEQAEVALRAIRGRNVAIIFQDPMTALNPVLRVGEQIAEVLHRHFNLTRYARYRRVLALLGEVGIVAPAACYCLYPHQLSGGMKQRIVIAMALAGEPEVLLADEPTTALDVITQAQILLLLQQLQRSRQMAILLITHDLAVVRQIADRVAVMYAGHVVEQADCQQFFAAPQHPYSQALFAAAPDYVKRSQGLPSVVGHVDVLTDAGLACCRFVARCPHAMAVCHTRAPDVHFVHVQQNVRCHLFSAGMVAPENAVATNPVTGGELVWQGDEEILRVAHLHVHFPVRKGLWRRVRGTVRAVDGVDLQLHAGKTVALVGESGCGKTTLAQSILQLLPISSGRVYFRQQLLNTLDFAALRRVRQSIQVIFQDPLAAMNPRLLAGDIVGEGLLLQKISKAQREARVQALFQQVGLSAESYWRYPHEFSGGQRQRICIARALAPQPQLIICDEPTSALDVSVQAQILNLLQTLQRSLGVAYLFITHNLAVVSFLADEVAVMYRGKIVEYGTVEEILHGAQHPYTQALLAAVPRHDRVSLGEVPVRDVAASVTQSVTTGCPFHPRCIQAQARCRTQAPPTKQRSTTHTVVCWL